MLNDELGRMDYKAESESVPMWKQRRDDRDKYKKWLAGDRGHRRQKNEKQSSTISFSPLKTTTQKSQTACIVALKILKTSNHSLKYSESFVQNLNSIHK